MRACARKRRRKRRSMYHTTVADVRFTSSVANFRKRVSKVLHVERTSPSLIFSTMEIRNLHKDIITIEGMMTYTQAVSNIPWCPLLMPPFLLNRMRVRQKVNMRYLSCHRTVSREDIKKNEKDYRNVARKLNTTKLEEKLMSIAVGDVTVNTNGHARPFLRFRLWEKDRIDDDDIGMTKKRFPDTENTVRIMISTRNFWIFR